MDASLLLPAAEDEQGGLARRYGAQKVAVEVVVVEGKERQMMRLTEESSVRKTEGEAVVEVEVDGLRLRHSPTLSAPRSQRDELRAILNEQPDKHKMEIGKSGEGKRGRECG